MFINIENKKKILATAILCLVLGTSMAQKKGDNEYSTAIGLRTYPNGITFKQFISDQAALEVVGYFWQGARVTALYQLYNEIGIVDRLNWYYGGGAHVGIYNSKNYGGGTFLGLDGVIGLDYKINNFPLNISLDWQPSLEFGSGAGLAGGWGGLGIRYVIK